MTADVEQRDVGVARDHVDVLETQTHDLGRDLAESTQDALPHLAGAHE